MTSAIQIVPPVVTALCGTEMACFHSTWTEDWSRVGHRIEINYTAQHVIMTCLTFDMNQRSQCVLVLSVWHNRQTYISALCSGCLLLPNATCLCTQLTPTGCGFECMAFLAHPKWLGGLLSLQSSEHLIMSCRPGHTTTGLWKLDG